MNLFTYCTLFLIYFCKFSCPQPVNTSNTTINPVYVVTPWLNDETTTEKIEASSENRRRGKGMMHYDDHSYEDYHKPEPVVEQKAVKGDPWAGYYDFLINEGSFKFWAAFQLGTALILVYSAFAAVYYAKFNPITSDYDDYDDQFIFRSNGRSATDNGINNNWFGLDASTFQNIINAVTSKKYS